METFWIKLMNFGGVLLFLIGFLIQKEAILAIPFCIAGTLLVIMSMDIAYWKGWAKAEHKINTKNKILHE